MQALSLRRTRSGARFSAIALLSVALAVPAVAIVLPKAVHAAPGAGPTAVYDAIGPVVGGNVPSEAFQATQTSEFGDWVGLAAGPRGLKSVTVELSSWGCESGTGVTCMTSPGATFTHPITLNLYAVDNTGALPKPVVGPPLVSQTVAFNIPFRPSATPSCPGGTKWKDAAGVCNNGLATPITFVFAGSPQLPDQLIWTVAYNTTSYGAAPIGTSAACFSTVQGCGYDSLNVGLSGLANPLAGHDLDTNGVFSSTVTAGNYCDGGAGGTGTLRDDTAAGTACWGVTAAGGPYRPMATIVAVAPSASSTTIVVDTAHPNGWGFVDDNGNGGSGQFVTGPSPSPAGRGSAQLNIAGTTQGFILANAAFGGTRLDELTTLNYSSFQPAGIHAPALAFDVRYRPTDSAYGGRLVFEPYYTAGTVAGGWQSWTALDGVWWSSKSGAQPSGSLGKCVQAAPCTWSQVLQFFPDAEILPGGAIVFKVGSGWAENVSDNVDNFTIGIAGTGAAITEKTFDFEPAPVAPTAPLSPVGTAGDGHVNVSWSSPFDLGGSPITAYIVTASPGGATCSTTSATTCLVTGLTNGTPYTFTVTATNGAGTSPASAPSAPVTPLAPNTAPGAPTNVVATAGDATAALSWTAPASNGGSAITSYTVAPTSGAGSCVVAGGSAACSGVTNGAAYTFTVHAVNAIGAGPGSVSNSVTPVATGVGGPPASVLDFNPAGPRRVFDTRAGQSAGALVSIAKGKVGNGNILTVKLTDLTGLVPATGVGAVSLNVTAVNATANGFVTVFPCGTQPFVSSVNFTPGANVANAVIAPVSVAGTICFFSSQPVDLITDVNGWFAAGRAFVPAGPARVLDTRAGLSPDAVVSVPKTPIVGGTVLTAKVTDLTGITPATGVGTVSLNVTAVDPLADGFLTVYDCGTRADVSSLNFVTGQTVANAVLAPVSVAGTVCIYSSQTTDVVVDINGYLLTPSGFTGVSPKRVFDTRPGFSPTALRTVSTTKVGGDTILEVKIVDLAGAVPATGVGAVSLNVTAVGPSADGYITVYPCGTRPDSSSVNDAAGQTVANAVITPVSTTGTVCFFSQNPTDLVVDVNGWFTSIPS